MCLGVGDERRPPRTPYKRFLFVMALPIAVLVALAVIWIWSSEAPPQAIVDRKERIDLRTQVLIIPTDPPKIEDHWFSC